MARIEVDLGPVDAYAIAVAEGYTGTREQWVQTLADAEANGLKAEGYAVGEQNGTPVASGEYFENNAKYYNEQAQSAKEDAETAQTAAETAQTAAETAQTAAETAAARDTAAWLNKHITNPDSPPLDRTLMSSSAAAPADMVGELKSALSATTRNLFDGISAFSSCKLENGKVTNTNTDSKTNLSLQVLFRNGTTTVTGSNFRTITATGRQSFTITPSGSGDNIFVKHNGSTRDISFTIPFNFTAQAYTVSVNVEGYNPSTVGGMVISEIQIETGSSATEYIPHISAVDYEARQIIETIENDLDDQIESVREETAASDERIIEMIDTTSGEKHYLFEFINGSPQNPSNTYLVTSDYIPITNGEKIKVIISGRNNTSGYRYVYGFAIYNSAKTILTYTDVDKDYTSPEYLAESSQTIAYARVCVGEFDAAGNHTTLRASDFTKETACVSSPIDLLLRRIDGKTDVIRSARYSSDGNFVFFTDIHGSKRNMKRIVSAVNHIGNIDAVINGGDTVISVLSDMTWYNNLVDDCDTDVLICIGNHDAWAGTPGTAATKADVYSAQIAPMVSKVPGIVQPASAASAYDCYYYKDYGDIRVVVLDAMTGDDGIAHYDSAQNTWFANVLADAITNGKTVLAVNHTPFAQDDITRDDSLNWNSWHPYTSADTMAIAEGALDCVDTFVSNGGKFVCWLTGHKHYDNVVFSTDHPNQFMFNSATANFYNHNIDGVNSNDLFSELYDCITMVSIDTTNSMIKFYRIGYVVDGGMRRRETLCYDYNTHEIIAH